MTSGHFSYRVMRKYLNPNRRFPLLSGRSGSVIYAWSSKSAGPARVGDSRGPRRTGPAGGKGRRQPRPEGPDRPDRHRNQGLLLGNLGGLFEENRSGPSRDKSDQPFAAFAKVVGVNDREVLMDAGGCMSRKPGRCRQASRGVVGGADYKTNTPCIRAYCMEHMDDMVQCPRGVTG
jgi:hypothetical protein